MREGGKGVGEGGRVGGTKEGKMGVREGRKRGGGTKEGKRGVREGEGQRKGSEGGRDRGREKGVT